MGIPFYYRAIIVKDQKKLLTNLVSCDRLFLDFNSVIHTCSAFAVANSKSDDSIEELHSIIFEQIFKHTMMLTKICKPKTLLYISIDGVAPRSKIQQQRKRRFLSAYRTNIVNEFKDAHNVKYHKWDSNCITPGTEFMDKLHTFLKKKIEITNTEFTCILSGANEKGEGEQKIFDYIRCNQAIENTYDVIYGLDADLIMLSLCCPTKSDIYLMREGNDFFTGMTDFKFLNISALKKSVYNYICDDNNDCDNNNNDKIIASIYDYVFICFLLGNDFIPNIAAFKIKTGAIDIICDVYRNVVSKLKQNIIIMNKHDRSFNVNFEFLIMFIELLSNNEDTLMKETTKQFYEQTYQMKTNTNKFERFTNELDNYPMINKFPLVIDPVNDSAWKSSYYYHLFNNNNHDNIRVITDNYIEGMLWIVNYYFNNNFDNTWYFKYNYSPCLSDVYNNLRNIKTQDNFNNIQLNLMNKISNTIINPHIQLLMVLPSLSASLLDNDSQKILTEIEYGCCHYYPLKFLLTTYLKHQLWECTPVLPNIDIDNIIRAYEKIKTKGSLLTCIP